MAARAPSFVKLFTLSNVRGAGIDVGVHRRFSHLQLWEKKYRQPPNHPTTLYRRSAQRAARCFQRNAANTERALLSGGRRSRRLFLQPVKLLHYQEHHKRDDEEIQYGIQELPISDYRRARLLRRVQRGVSRPVP